MKNNLSLRVTEYCSKCRQETSHIIEGEIKPTQGSSFPSNYKLLICTICGIERTVTDGTKNSSIQMFIGQTTQANCATCNKATEHAIAGHLINGLKSNLIYVICRSCGNGKSIASNTSTS